MGVKRAQISWGSGGQGPLPDCRRWADDIRAARGESWRENAAVTESREFGADLVANEM